MSDQPPAPPPEAAAPAAPALDEAALTDRERAILADLNPAQREAVTHGDGPLLVVAGAGSGKTRVVTRRVAWLLERGLPARALLAITFTNKAAEEMRLRVQALVPGAPVWLSTFHSLGARLLRIEGAALGLPRDFSIYDSDDTQALLKDCLLELNQEVKSFRPAALRAAVSRLKNEGVAPAEAPTATWRQRVLAEVYELYEAALRKSGALDFDDLLLRTVRLFESHPEILARWRERFRHVLIDEYQDTNAVQYRLVRLLGAHGNVCATGDPDQAIYGWRGADLRNILEFARDFPGTRVVRLEENYRSTGNVLAAAGALIVRNAERLERGLWTRAPAGAPVRLVAVADEEAEALELAAEIERRVRRGGSYGDCAVLYRTNAQSRALETVFVGHGIPYAVYGGVAFYQRREVKDLLAWLRVLLNPADDLAFRRAAGFPRRGLGEKTLERLGDLAAPDGLSLRQAAGRVELRGELGPRAAEALAAFARLLDELAAAAGELALPELIRRVIQESGYAAALDPEAERDRLENLEELAAAAEGFLRENPEGGLREFLEQAALYAETDEFDARADRVALMTLHSAKGLEFPCVFLAGLEERLLPHVRALEDEERGGARAALEEERRLLYVGLTRAREQATLTFARERHGGATHGPAVPSRFLRELGEAGVEKVDRTGQGFPALERPRPEDDWRGALEVESGLRHPPRAGTDWAGSALRGGPAHPAGRVVERGGGVHVEYEPEAAGAADEAEADERARAALAFAVGERVRHPKFGQGKIIELSGTDPESRVAVQFDRYGRKQLILGLAKLRHG